MIENFCLKSVQVVNVRIRSKSSYSVRVSIVCFYCAFCFFKFIQFVRLYSKKKQRNFWWFIEQNIKIQHTIKFLSSRKHPRVLLCRAAPTFMLFHYSLFLKFDNNFEISCQGTDLHLKLSLQFKIILSISDFGVSTAILDPLDVFRRWCKLNFSPMRDQVKSRHFSE